MKEKTTRSKVSEFLATAKNLAWELEYNNNCFKMNLEGEIVQTPEQKITLKSIYEFMKNFKDETNNKFYEQNTKFESINCKLKAINDELKTVNKRLNTIEKLPIISKELQNL